MHAVIDIDKEVYDHILKAKSIPDLLGIDIVNAVNAVKNGVPLPRGHGRIGDLDKLIKDMKERNDDNGGEPLNAVDRGYDLAYQHMVEEAKDCVFIKADRSKES